MASEFFVIGERLSDHTLFHVTACDNIHDARDERDSIKCQGEIASHSIVRVPAGTDPIEWLAIWRVKNPGVLTPNFKKESRAYKLSLPNFR